MNDRDIIAKLMFALWTFYIVISGFISDSSLTSFMVAVEGKSGYAVILSVSVILLILLLDVVINDWLGTEYTFIWAIKNRHYVYTFASFLFLMPLYSAARFDSIDIPQCVFYGGAALSGWILGFRDMMFRRSECDTQYRCY